MFSLCEMPPYLLVAQVTAWNTTLIHLAVLNLLTIVPQKSVLVCLEHGHSRFSVQTLVSIVEKSMALVPDIVLHINHEQPWVVSPNSYGFDYIFNTTALLVEGYSNFPLVIRTYYYEPLTTSSLYIPLGPSYFGNTVGNRSSHLYLAKHVRPSKRSTFCYFAGIFNYHPATRPKDLVDGDTLHYQQRVDLYDLSRQGSGSGDGDGRVDSNSITNLCTIKFQDPWHGQEGDDEQVGVLLDYEKYIPKLADTVFCPCPSGNNPETFRLYEALEVGCIPLFVRPPEDKDFTKHGEWNSYPGVIFNSWNDLNPFLMWAQHNPREVDLLHHSILRWYESMLLFAKKNVAHSVDAVMGRDSIAGGLLRRRRGETRSRRKDNNDIYNLNTKHLAERQQRQQQQQQQQQEENEDDLDLKLMGCEARASELERRLEKCQNTSDYLIALL